MSQKFLFDASFHLFLNKIDQELVNKSRQEGCLFCGGKLHRADYPRSPLGIPPEFRDDYDSRLSSCCDGCRKRTTPMSIRFFGRRWYPAPLFILISLFTLGINKRRLAQIKKYFGLVVSETSWRRWRKWWRDAFTQTKFWQQEKGRLPSTPAIIQGPYPRVLLDVLQGKLKEKMGLLLRFFAPLTGGVLRAV